MPCFRGLDGFISVHPPHSQRLPERPHPDSLSVHLLLPTNSSSAAAQVNKRLSVFKVGFRHFEKASPRVSIYTPSILDKRHS